MISPFMIIQRQIQNHFDSRDLNSGTLYVPGSIHPPAPFLHQRPNNGPSRPLSESKGPQLDDEDVPTLHEIGLSDNSCNPSGL